MAKDMLSLVKTVLEAGTWTNFTTSSLGTGKNPPIFRLYKDKVVRGNEYITLETAKRSPIQSFSGSTIVTPKSCLLKHFTRNETDRDAIYDDIIDIFQVSNYGFDILDVNESSPNKITCIQDIKLNVLN